MPSIPHTKRRDVIRVFESLGYRFARSGGRHDVYQRSASLDLYIPRHAEVSPGVIRNLCKAAAITVEEFLDAS